ncbi:type II toxin-antitoxin system RelE/ParE family toxin [Alteromonas sp. a30]|uniref:type II toxin-antitoxin system RelE/ParE family toxin n=1 Tax=Alteromonas sp. a30 TaxID=2730917 RepID=UPI0022803500|nr:type II toxin-antitoxin system RelE/ParE family toxin [Alteromonas sp. a30]MCY7296477.1 type II toxin-antitoxin system RelE/ParE family toxin [Alteromonas sp. a30]
MGNYRISNSAREDLQRIWLWGLEQFGEAQADTYFTKLIERFEMLAAKPHLAPSVDHIRAGYRRNVCGSESIYYRIEDEYIEIMAVIGRQDIHNHLSDNEESQDAIS